jgi:hypothetical protein
LCGIPLIPLSSPMSTAKLARVSTTEHVIEAITIPICRFVAICSSSVAAPRRLPDAMPGAEKQVSYHRSDRAGATWQAPVMASPGRGCAIRAFAARGGA